MASKKKTGVLTADQQKHLLSRISEILRRNLKEIEKPASVIAAEKARAAAEKIIHAWNDKRCDSKCSAIKKRADAATKARNAVYFPKSADDALAAVEKFDSEFGKDFEDSSCFC